MQVTVVEALRLKKEIAAHIREIETERPRYRMRTSDNDDSKVCYGTRWEDGEEMIDEGKTPVNKKVENLIAILKVSAQINKSISDFNHVNGIGDLVRERQNAKMVLEYYQNIILPKSVPTTKSVRDKESGKVTKVKFEPFLKKSEVRERIKILKSDIRDLQSEIETFNVKKIELPFSYDEVYNLMNEC